MNISELLHPLIQKYIVEKTAVEVSKLALQKNPFSSIDFKIILNQIEARAKCKLKLPTLFQSENIIYPSKISIEQTSSEQTALYKSTCIVGDSLIDLTGGFGVDTYYFSKQFKKVAHCEINTELSQITQHNFDVLKVKNVTFYSDDSTVVLQQLKEKVDWIYIDPSRRNDAKGKVFMLKDCLPNVPESLDIYFKYSNSIVIKTAPILDITAGLRELQFVKNIHIIAVENEVKELLWEIENNYVGKINIKTCNLSKGKAMVLDIDLNSTLNSNVSFPKKYLYEPNSAIMKSGEFAAIGSIFKIEKLHEHSHLYTSEKVIDFPGRVFEIYKQLEYTKTNMKEYFEKKQFNITTRNFPESVENLRKKWKINDGGTDYCFFTTNKNNTKIVLLCSKINV